MFHNFMLLSSLLGCSSSHSKINSRRSHIKMLKLFILTLCVLSTLAHYADVAKHEDLIQRYIDNVFETYEVKGEDDPVVCLKNQHESLNNSKI